MKKSVISLIFLMTSLILLSSVKQNAFDSFMGMRWGTNAAEFRDKFISEVESIGSRSYAREAIKFNGLDFKDGFYISDFKLGNLFIELVAFEFNPIEEDISWKEKNFDKFKFSNTVMFFDPTDFDTMLEILKAKYGEPKSSREFKQQISVFQEKEHVIFRDEEEVKSVLTEMIQHEVIWKNEDRMVLLRKYSENNSGIGLVFFDKSDADDVEKAADLL